MNLKKNLFKMKGFIALTALLCVFQTAYIFARFSYLNVEIPFWYSLPWGETQLAPKAFIYAIPLVSWLIFILGTVMILVGSKFRLRLGKEILQYTVFFSLVLLTMSAIRLIFIASSPFEPIVNADLLKLIVLFSGGFLIAYLIAPKVINYLVEKGIVTDPGIHKHPAMILVKPSARGGGLIFAAAFLIVAIFSVPLSKPVIGLLIGVVAAALLGYADDIQNTKKASKFGFLENPIIRLIGQTVIALFLVMMGFRIDFINNPFDGIIYFNQFDFTLLGIQMYPVAIFITTLWLVWIMNMLSWANAIDGQYSGIIGIAGVCLVFLAMRPGLEPPIIPKEVIAALALILAGASLGLLPFNWHPSKIMWGFGAIAAGLVFASLAIATRAKISASIIVILIPFMDGLIILVRRILQGKFPLKADKQHLHHLLLERGWGVKKIAVFYWISTAILGVISIFAADKDVPLLVLSVAGGVGFMIVILNLQSRKSRLKQQQPE